MLQDVAKTIGLSPAELEALLEVRDALRAEQITFFDMRCGFFCIAGHIGRRLGTETPSDYTEHVGHLPLGNPMRELCYPPQPKGATDRSYGYYVGQVDAAKAIDRMLAGEQPWPPTS